MDHFIAFLIGASSGIAAAAVAGLLAFRTTVWEKRRHDYAQLLIALTERNKEEILKRLELVALIGSNRVRNPAQEIKKKLLFQETPTVAEQDAAHWHALIFELMRKDILGWKNLITR